MRPLVALLLALLVLAPAARAQVTSEPITGARVPCQDGTAAGFPCLNVDLFSFLPISAIGGTEQTKLNDIWGWTDPQTGKEYALVGRTDGTAFVDVSDPLNPVYLGELPTETVPSVWRDIKTYGNHAYVVADGAGDHGLQVFDLTQLRNVSAPPMTFSPTAVYHGFGSSHNIVVNEASGFAYAVGLSGRQTPSSCGPGLHMVSLADPANPAFAGCYTARTDAERGYTHDAQCVNYDGPDSTYRGREICFASNEDVFAILDVEDKTSPAIISMSTYPDAKYIHQGWLTEDHAYFYMDDELDEWQAVTPVTRTVIWDLSDLDDPVATFHYGATPAIDHNQYIRDHFSFQANYRSGLRVLDISDVLSPTEIAYFDTFPADDRPDFDGAWSNYPFFESGIVVVSSIGEGLFVLDPTGPVNVAAGQAAELPEAFALEAAYPNPFNPRTTITLAVDRPQRVRVAVYDLLGRPVATLHDGPVAAAGRHTFTFDAAGLPSGVYLVRAHGAERADLRRVTLVK